MLTDLTVSVFTLQFTVDMATSRFHMFDNLPPGVTTPCTSDKKKSPTVQNYEVPGWLFSCSRLLSWKPPVPHL